MRDKPRKTLSRDLHGRGPLPRQGADGGQRKRLRGADTSLVHKYRALNEKYQALVERHSEIAGMRSASVTLALGAMSSGSTALALVRGGRIVTSNDHWHRLQSQVGRFNPWQLERGDGMLAGERYFTLWDLAVRGAATLLERHSERVRVELFSQIETGRYVEVRLERLKSRKNWKRPSVMVIAHDVTSRVRTEQELDRAREAMFEQERMRAVGELASGIAHDLNNTLHAMNMRLVRLRRSGALDEAQQSNVDALIRMVGDTAARIGRLQELARHRQDVPHEAVDIGIIIAEAVSVAKPELEDRSLLSPHRVVIETDVPTELPPIVGASADLRHVFLNLLLNARDAMPQGGRIRVEVRRSGDWVVIAVKDEGVGIPQEHLGRIFDPFFTTKGKRGTGLGLSIAYGVMSRLGGSIAAGNRPEGGAVVTLNFPVAGQPREVGRPQEQPLPPRGRRVLVIDDDLDNLEATRWVLEDLGQQVECAASGPEALAYLERGEQIDLVLCDIGMPGMNGWETVERLQQIAPGSRVFMLSGWAQEIAMDDERRRLVRAVLPKPLPIDEIKKALASLPDTAAPAPSQPPPQVPASVGEQHP